MAPSSPDVVYQLHIRLLDSEPMIWRRIVVSGNVNLYRLHLHLQVVMNWEFSHLHQFVVGNTYYGEPDPEDGVEMKDERRARLRTIAPKKEDRFFYEYDFGDSWRHEITVEEIKPLTEDMWVPRCLGGARACPPEDCGGVGGYTNLLEALKDRRHPEHRELRQWVGESYDPNVFSVQAVNSALALLVVLEKHG